MEHEDSLNLWAPFENIRQLADQANWVPVAILLLPKKLTEGPDVHVILDGDFAMGWQPDIPAGGRRKILGGIVMRLESGQVRTSVGDEALTTAPGWYPGEP